MGIETAVLLVGFGLAKMGIAAAIVWLGMRSGERPDDGDDFRGRAPEDTPPPLPARRGRRRSSARGGPARSPASPPPRRARA